MSRVFGRLSGWTAMLCVLMGLAMAQVAPAQTTPAGGAGDPPLTAAQQKELDALFNAVMDSPGDTAANLRYAKAAERFGQTRKAAAAYERVAVNDPGNVEAQAGFQRLKLKLEPPATRFRLAIGTQYESNASAVNSQVSPALQGFNQQSKPDGAMVASLRIDDDRQIGNLLWHTRATIYGEAHFKYSDYDYDFFSIVSGPVFVLDNGWTLRFGPAFEVGFQGYNFLYWSAGGVIDIDFPTASLVRNVRFLVMNAKFTQDSASRDGPLFYGRAEIGKDHVFTRGDTLLFEPYSSYYMAMGYSHQDRYYQIGATLTYAIPIVEQVLSFKQIYFVTQLNAEYRPYAGREPLPPDVDKGNRRDWRLNPGVKLVGTNLLDRDITAVLSYDYDRSRSNYDSYSYNNHKVALSFVLGF